MERNYKRFLKESIFLILIVCVLSCILNLAQHMIFTTGSMTVVSTPAERFQIYAVCFLAGVCFLILIICLQNKFYARQGTEIGTNCDKITPSDNARSHFLNNMSHEIRTPMNAIISLSEVIQKEELNEEARIEVNMLRTASYDLLSIIDDVLTYARIDAGKLHLAEEPYRFEQLERDVLASISHELQKKGLHLDIQINHNIPRLLWGDNVILQQLFLYLLFISIDNTTNGRIILDIDCDNDYENEICTLKCKVADTGKGLSKIDVDSLFSMYETYDSRQSSNLKGIGLKFAICKELLKMMDGDIHVESIEGVGLCTSFYFRNKIVDPQPMISLKSDEKPNVLIYVADDVRQQKWQQIMEGFRIRPKYIRNYHSFDRVLQEKKYDFIFIYSSVYNNLANIIELYGCEENTYVVGEYNNVYGDFGKCRLIRRPTSCIGVAEVLNHKWNKEDYRRDVSRETFTAKDARVLVVDDNAVNLKVAKGIFSKYKIDISVATSGEDSLRKIESEKYDLILMDMVMPDINGDEVLRRVRAKEENYYKEVPVIALTAKNGPDVRDEVLAFGFQEYLAKPLRVRYLEKSLLEFLPEEIISYDKVEDKKEEKREEKKTEGKRTNTQASSPAPAPAADHPAGGLNTDKGLLNVGFNKEAYTAILNTYYSEGLRSLESLPGQLENDIRLFTTNVHGIKSSSASIGAMEVSALFKELEFAGKDGRIEEIREKFNPYMEKFKEILEIVKQYLIDNGEFEETVEEDLENKEVEVLTLEELQSLKSELNKMNLKVCDERIPEMAGKNYGAETNNQIKKLKEAYDMFDFHQAKLALNELITAYGGSV